MLHELVEYAKEQGLAAEPGFNAKYVRWLLLFNEQGRWVGLADLTDGDKKSKGKLFHKCPDLSMPEMVSAGKGTRHFLVDALDKVTLLTKDSKVTPKLASEHEYFVNLLAQASSEQAVFGNIAQTLGDDAQLQVMRVELAEKKAKPTDSATLAVLDASTGKTRTFVSENWWHDWWRSFRQNLVDRRQARSSNAGSDSVDSSQEEQMLCLLTGMHATPAATHPKINSLSDVGGLSMGDALLSFNKEAFRSFNLEEGQNAAISEEMASTYTGALNDLLRTRCHRLSNVKIVYWYAGVDIPPGSTDDILHTTVTFEGVDHAAQDNDDDEGDSLAPSESEINSQYGLASRLVQSIDSGERPELLQARFHSLVLSANSGRVVIRDWQQGDFKELAHAVKKWFDDLAIIARDGRSIIRSFKLMALVGACVRELKDAPATLQLNLWKCALNPNRKIPDSIAAHVLERIRIDIINDQSPRHARFALLKAYLIRKGYLMTQELNDHCHEPAYLCGKLLAQLARIQYQALGDVGAGVTQRYYAAASATPALVIGRLMRTANTGHIPKLSEKDQYWAQKNLSETWNDLNKQPPVTLSLEKQTLFAMGYYQELAKRFNKTKGDDVPEPIEA